MYRYILSRPTIPDFNYGEFAIIKKNNTHPLNAADTHPLNTAEPNPLNAADPRPPERSEHPARAASAPRRR